MKTGHQKLAAQFASAVLLLLWLFPPPAAAVVLNDRCDRQGRPLVIPAPKEYRLTGGKTFRLTGGAAVEDRSGGRATSALKVLRQLFPAPGAGTVELQYDASVRNPEGFRVSVEGARIVLRASDGRGFYYAARTVADLVRNSGAGIPALEIQDEPALAFRGLAFSCRELSGDKIPAFKRLVSTLGALRYNHLVLEFADNFPYRDRPFTKRRSTLTEAELREIVEHIRDQQIEIVPQLQIQSHVRWLSTHPDFERFLEAPASRLWISSYCPNDPEVRKLVFRCLREQLEFFKPELFDICFDEVTTCVFRQCEKCRAYTPDDLLYKHLKEVCDFIFAHGSTPLFTHDMFIPGWHEKVLDRMDRRCRINYWRYSATPLDLFSFFSEKGFTVYGMPLLGYMDNVAWMAKLARKHHTGVIPTFWHHFDRTLHDPRPSSPECYGALVAAAETAWDPDLDRELLPYDPVYELRRRLYAGTPHNATYEMGQLGDFRPDPALLTIPGATEDPVAQWRRDGLIATPMPLGRVVNAEFGELADFPRFSAPEHLKRLADELAAAPERFHLATSGNFYYGVAVAGSAKDRVLPDRRTIPVERRAAGFSFLLTASRPENTNHFVPYAKHGVKKKLRAGTLALCYADGTAYELPLYYRYNLNDWASEFGGIAMRHANRDADDLGQVYNFGVCDVVNPHPDKEIRSLELSGARCEGIAPVLLAATLWRDIPVKFASVPEFMPERIVLRAASSAPVQDFPLFDASKLPATPGIRLVYPDKTSPARVAAVPDEHGEKIWRVTVPPVPPGVEKSRIMVELPLEEVPAEAKSVYFEFKVDRPEQFQYCGVYLMEPENGGAEPPHYGFFFHQEQTTELWRHLEVPFDQMREFSGPTGHRRAVKFALSFWFTNDREVNLYLRRAGFSSAAGCFRAPPRQSTLPR